SPSTLRLFPRQPSFRLFPYTTLFRSPLFHILTAHPENNDMYRARVVFVASLYLSTMLQHAQEDMCQPPVPVNGYPQPTPGSNLRSEEHTSELQSRFDLVCRLLLQKKN